MAFNRLFSAFLLLPLVAGCSPPEPPYGVVDGVVTLDGKPLSDVEVVFMPDSAKGTSGRRSVARTDKEGRYHLLDDGGKDGAIVGSHRVIVNDVLLSKSGSAPVVVGPDDAKGGVIGMKGPPPSVAEQRKSRFPDDYSNILSTPLKDIEVKSGTQTIDLKLKR